MKYLTYPELPSDSVCFVKTFNHRGLCLHCYICRCNIIKLKKEVIIKANCFLCNYRISVFTHDVFRVYNKIVKV